MATQDQLERKRIVGDYVRERLVAECRQKWGQALVIAKRTGFSAAHVSNVKDGHRNVGDSFAMAMADYWGMTYSDLERLALERLAERLARYGVAPAAAQGDESQAAADRLPQLTAVLAECTEDLYPRAFLAEYERRARTVERDRPKNVWLGDLEAKYWEWREERQKQLVEASLSGMTRDASASVTNAKSSIGASQSSGVRTPKAAKNATKRAKAG